jgi:hypothetical protein
MDPRWLGVIGIALDIVGAGVLAYDVIVYMSTRRAVKDYGSLLFWKDSNLSEVRRVRRAAWRGLIGYVLLVLGFLCQMYSAWPT